MMDIAGELVQINKKALLLKALSNPIRLWALARFGHYQR